MHALVRCMLFVHISARTQKQGEEGENLSDMLHICSTETQTPSHESAVHGATRHFAIILTPHRTPLLVRRVYVGRLPNQVCDAPHILCMSASAARQHGSASADTGTAHACASASAEGCAKGSASAPTPQPLHLMLVGLSGTRELREVALAARQLHRHAGLHEAAVREHEELVAIHDGADAVRDDDHRALRGRAAAAEARDAVRTAHGLPERFLDDRVRLPAAT